MKGDTRISSATAGLPLLTQLEKRERNMSKLRKASTFQSCVKPDVGV